MKMYLPAAALLAGLLFAGTGFAQPAPGYAADGPGSYDDASEPANDPPSRVARLSLIQGAVSFVPAGEDEWVQAEFNRPLISGDQLWTDHDARAEMEIGSSAIRVDQQSSFNFLNLDDDMAQVELTQGTLNLRVLRIYDNQTYEVDTPTLAFVINRVGEYRIDVAPDGNGTIVTAFRGGGDAYGEAGARFRIEEGQSVRFNDSQLSDYVSNPVPNADDFDRFCFERDSRWDNSRSSQYVSEDVIGYADLDSYGSWDTAPEYGAVWYPAQVDAGWTPYSYGRWAWVGAYGWTWVDSSPWGFAPFHYGRWAWVHNRWGWCPGPRYARSYYAPALVAFVGTGGAQLSFSVGGPVGWFPLGPRDIYVPGYRVSHGYFTNINIHNTTITSVAIDGFYGNYRRGNFDYGRISYANRNVAGAVVAVRGDVFVNARQVRGSSIAVNRETFANARVAGFAAIAPTRQSLAFSGGGRAAAPPQAVRARNIVAATRPPAPIASFAQRESQLQRNPGHALSVSQLRTTPVASGNGAAAQQAAASRQNVRVVTRDGAPARTPAAANQSPASRQAENRAVTPRANPPQNPQTQNHNAAVPPANGRPRAGNNQGALPSSRYSRPNATDNPTQQRASGGGNNAATSRQTEQRTQPNNPQQYRSATAPQTNAPPQQQRAQPAQETQQRQAVQQQQQPQLQRNQGTPIHVPQQQSPMTQPPRAQPQQPMVQPQRTQPQQQPMAQPQHAQPQQRAEPAHSNSESSRGQSTHDDKKERGHR
jgi:hypothetical protein